MQYEQKSRVGPHMATVHRRLKEKNLCHTTDRVRDHHIFCYLLFIYYLEIIISNGWKINENVVFSYDFTYWQKNTVHSVMIFFRWFDLTNFFKTVSTKNMWIIYLQQNQNYWNFWMWLKKSKPDFFKENQNFSPLLVDVIGSSEPTFKLAKIPKKFEKILILVSTWRQS